MARSYLAHYEADSSSQLQGLGSAMIDEARKPRAQREIYEFVERRIALKLVISLANSLNDEKRLLRD